MKFKKGSLSIIGAIEIHRNLLLAFLSAIFILSAFFMAGNILFSSKSQAAAMKNTYKYYTSIEIQPGDTLWSIAEDHSTAEYGSIKEYVSELKELNGLGDDKIHAGQYLSIPYYSKKPK